MTPRAAARNAVGLLLALAILGGCAGRRPEPEGPLTFGPGKRDADGRYHSQGFSIAFPPGWQLKEDTPGMVVLAISPKEGDDDTFIENCGLAAEVLEKETSLEAYKEAALTQMQRSTPSFVMIHEESSFTHSGLDAKRVVYDQEVAGLELRMSVFFVVDGRRAYLLTCGTGKQVFAEKQPVFEQVAKSFQVETPS